MTRSAIAARLGVGVMLLIFWGLVDSPLSGVVFLLVLSALSVVRYRVARAPLLLVLETMICACYTNLE